MESSQVCSEICRKHLLLHLTSGIGPIRLAALIAELGDIDRVLAASHRELTRASGISDVIAERVIRGRNEIDVDAEIALAAGRGARILCLADHDYPAALRRIDDPPTCLYVRGTLEPEDAVALAIVGARHCSRYGAEQAERFAALLAGAGLTVVSGLARGIDTAAHRGALDAGGRTLAVLGCGLCHLYPPEAEALAERIVARGALISELPMEVAPDSKNFPPRNRIITGLSLGTLVVEAARRSGALITARLAAEYNREVFAIPGRIDNVSAEGCNDLIKSGAAKLVTRLEDVLLELGDVGAVLMGVEAKTPAQPSLPFDDSESNDPTGSPSNQPAAESMAAPARIAKLTPQEELTFTQLDSDALTIESICEIVALPPGQIAAALTGLQLKGLIRRVRGDLFERAKSNESG